MIDRFLIASLKHSGTSKKILFLVLPSLLLFVIVVFCYLPGVGATYLLDDFHILEPIGYSGGIRDFPSLMTYLTSGGGGPLGRPVALLTFALNAQQWPADPTWFVLTNILIHGATAVLAFYLVWALGVALNKSGKEVLLLAFFSSLIWALHPYHVSTVLYIVQRMTTLSAMFGLAGIVSYLMYRSAALKNQYYKLVGWATLTAVCCVLAVLSKESALLIPVYILAIELLLRWKNAPSSRLLDLGFRFLLLPAALIVIAYPIKVALSDIGSYLSTGEAPTHGRTFTMWERFLTQGRVLLDYQASIFFPRIQSPGVFHDEYTLSTGIFSPPVTFISWVSHLALIGGAIMWRRKAALLSFGILWFYIGHLLESTVVMLELKFEHRNYLPSLGLIIVFVAGTLELTKKLRSRIAALSLVSLTLSILLVLATSLWGKPYHSALVWAHENPLSSRAQEEAARRSIIYAGDLSSAKKYLRKMNEISPHTVNELKYLLVFCEPLNDEQPDWAEYADRMRSEPRDWSLVKVIDDLLKQKIRGECNLVTYEAIKALILGFRSNPLYLGQPSSLLSYDTEYEAAAFFGVNEDLKRLEYSIDLRQTDLWKTTKRAGVLATYGYLDMAFDRLSTAVELAKNGELYATDRSMADALEVLEQIEKDMQNNE